MYGVYRRWCTVYGAMACVGTVYGVQALGVRVCTCVCVVWCTLCVRVCVSFYDVVSV